MIDRKFIRFTLYCCNSFLISIFLLLLKMNQPNIYAARLRYRVIPHYDLQNYV